MSTSYSESRYTCPWEDCGATTTVYETYHSGDYFHPEHTAYEENPGCDHWIELGKDGKPVWEKEPDGGDVDWNDQVEKKAEAEQRQLEAWRIKR